MCLESRWNNCMFRGFVQKVEKSLIHNRFVWKCNFGSSLGTETVCWATVLCCSSCEGDVKNRRHNLYYKATSSYRVNVNQLDLRTKSETQHLPLNTSRNVLVCGTNKRILIWNDTQLLFSTLVIILWSLTINTGLFHNPAFSSNKLHFPEAISSSSQYRRRRDNSRKESVYFKANVGKDDLKRKCWRIVVTKRQNVRYSTLRFVYALRLWPVGPARFCLKDVIMNTQPLPSFSRYNTAVVRIICPQYQKRFVW